jgi:hypothetical protein
MDRSCSVVGLDDHYVLEDNEAEKEVNICMVDSPLGRHLSSLSHFL